MTVGDKNNQKIDNRRRRSPNLQSLRCRTPSLWRFKSQQLALQLRPLVRRSNLCKKYLIPTRCAWRTILVPITLVVSLAALADSVRIGILTDGPYARYPVSLPQIQQEIEELLSPEHRLLFPETGRRHGNWQVTSVRKELNQMLADGGIDMIFVMGPISVVTASGYRDLPKPVLAPFPIDNELLNLPIKGRGSGVRNFYYLSDFHSLTETLDALRRATGARHIHVIADGVALSPLNIVNPEKVQTLANSLGIELSLTLLDGKNQLSLPDNAQAVLIGPLARLTDQQFAAIAHSINSRQLPSFAMGGHSDLGLGALLSDSGDHRAQVQLGRRVALVLQRILGGEEPGTLDVSYDAVRRTEINLEIAQKIGFSPPWSLLLDARYYDDSSLPPTGTPISLTAAMVRGLEQNLVLNSNNLNVDIAREGVNAARSQLLPQLGLALQGSRIDADRASPLTQAEQSTDVSASASLVLYSDDAWSALRIQEHLHRASQSGQRADALDTLQLAAHTYVNVLRTRALMEVRKADVEATREHLQSARLRERIGFSGSSDVLRWDSELAADKQAFLSAQADFRNARTALNQVLHLSLDEELRVNDSDLNPVLALLQDPRLSRPLSTPAGWQYFKQFIAGEALAKWPEMAEIESLIAAQNREITAARRKYYVPEISLQAQAGSNLSRSGAGSDLNIPGTDDDIWSVVIRARLPLFSGGGLKSRLATGRYRAQQLQLQRQAISETLLARNSQALDRIAGSYPAIDLAQQQADSALRNLEIVADAYAGGAVDITRLVDAQNTSLQARLNAAQSRFRFLSDFIAALRSMGDFTLLTTPGEHEQWIERVSIHLKTATGS